MKNDELLKIVNLSYKKKQKTILQQVNLTLTAGHFIGLAGLNGAGKTTLMRLIAGVATDYQGQIFFQKETDIVKRKALVSYSDELRGFKKRTSLKEINQFYQMVYPDFDIQRYQELVAFLQLDNQQKLGALSKGMKERLIMALTLARKARLYLLDEPFSGIDVLSRKKIIQGMLSWIPEDATILISSHHLEEIVQILDELVVIKDQTVFAHRATDDILASEHCSVEEYFEQLYDEREAQND
ncbi:ABC transporter ATP-binding protein [Bombilactobacillus folatiphilus]|uniref:ABC transporter ATP-binding protein n=1 Tax=Bombilactobacillus folatiphilus TaxID=2923362 RepID=A0ABY4P9F9_9LACO|nr:ABC transporter ATP-binding protein [Bombilactobacillus folatiphilus]UQS82260.1 ABC transporter ATP-binding protein [Bombilactobacillus folatiphilus]